MKTTLYYFSGTGNSLKVAKDLAVQLEGDVELIPMVSEMKKGKVSTASGRVGFVFPVHTGGPATIVTDFIKKLEFTGSPYLFSVPTMSSDCGVTIQVINSALKGKASLSMEWPIKMGANNNLFMNIPGTTPILSKEEQEEVYRDADKQIKEIVQLVNSEKVHLEKKRGFQRIFITLIHKLYVKKSSTFDSHYQCDTKSCSSCRSCVDICPVGNIKYAEGKPEWQNNCIGCVACFNYCPTGAVKHLMVKSEEMDRRYHHSAIDSEELRKQN